MLWAVAHVVPWATAVATMTFRFAGLARVFVVTPLATLVALRWWLLWAVSHVVPWATAVATTTFRFPGHACAEVDDTSNSGNTGKRLKDRLRFFFLRTTLSFMFTIQFCILSEAPPTEGTRSLLREDGRRNLEGRGAAKFELNLSKET